MLTRRFISILVILLMALLTFISCASPYPKEMTISKAEKHLGVTLPVPTYLPEDYAISKLFLTEENDDGYAVLIVIRDKTNSNPKTPDLNSPPGTGEINLQIGWHATGGPTTLKVLDEHVDISGGPGVYLDAGFRNRDYIDFWWNWNRTLNKP